MYREITEEIIKINSISLSSRFHSQEPVAIDRENGRHNFCATIIPAAE
jgi:hypothetical protein